MDPASTTSGLVPLVKDTKLKRSRAPVQTVKLANNEQNPNSRVFVVVRGAVAIRRLQAFRDEMVAIHEERLYGMSPAARERLDEYWGDLPDSFLTVTDGPPPGMFAGWHAGWKESIDWLGIQAAHDWRCLYCGERHQEFEADHIYPVSRGGSDEANNIAPACRACNRSKHAMPLYRWLGVRTDLSVEDISLRWQRARPGVSLDLGDGR